MEVSVKIKISRQGAANKGLPLQRKTRHAPHSVLFMDEEAQVDLIDYLKIVNTLIESHSKKLLGRCWNQNPGAWCT